MSELCGDCVFAFSIRKNCPMKMEGDLTLFQSLEAHNSEKGPIGYIFYSLEKDLLFYILLDIHIIQGWQQVVGISVVSRDVEQ